jgi:predicted dehydrogenase
MLEDDRISAVAVVTPDFAHAEPAVAAAEAGRHVLVEKPLVTSREDGIRLARAVKANGVQIMTDFHNRWSPVYFKIKKDIEKGKLGRVISAYMRLNDDVDWPSKQLPWAAETSILWFLGSHTVDVLCWLFDNRVNRVYAVSREGVLRDRGIDVPDMYQAILEFESGGIASIENGWICPSGLGYVNDHKFNILGEKGMFNVDFSHNSLLERYREDRSDHPDILVRPVIQGRPTGLAFDSIRDFVDRIYFGQEVIVDLESSLHVTAVILAILESAEKREPVMVEDIDID